MVPFDLAIIDSGPAAADADAGAPAPLTLVGKILEVTRAFTWAPRD